MNFTSFLDSGKLTVALTGEIDHHCAKAYIQVIAAKIETYMPEVCVLDFRDVTFVDSSGIAVVINALRSMSPCGYSGPPVWTSLWKFGRRYHEVRKLYDSGIPQ